MKTGLLVFTASTLILLGTATYCCVAIIPQAHAQTSSSDSSSGASIPDSSTLTPDQRAALQAQYDELQQEIAQWQTVIDQTKAKEASLKGDVTTLNAQIAQAQAQINQRELTVSSLSDAIDQKSQSIQSLEQEISDGKDGLAKLLREENQEETTPLAILALSDGSLTNFLSDVDNIDSVDQSLQNLFAQLSGTETQTQAQKDALAAQQNQQLDAEHDAQLLKQTIAVSQQQKQQLLTATTQDEESYQQVLAQKQNEATQIKNALFDLRDTQGISFESALNYANVAQKATGVAPALILAILSQESDLGQNVGSCEMTSLTSGDGKSIKDGTTYQEVMKPGRDTTPFATITSALGIDWQSTPVSCPLGRTYTASRGYGGALGPSQFIPSTWQLFSPRIDTALGQSGQADPWDPQQAIMATALYMEDLGAAGGTYTAERNAACKYYSGRACDTRTPINYTYGNSVIAKADQFQQNIDCINDVSTCSLPSSN